MCKEFNLGSPFDRAVIGLTFNQDEYPWWVTSIMSWIRQVQFVIQCHGKQSDAHRKNMDRILAKGNPHEVYEAYKSCVMYQDWVESGGESQPNA